MPAASRSPVVLRSLMLAAAGVLPLGLLAASAQAPHPPPQAETPPAHLNALKARDQELEALRAEQRRTTREREAACMNSFYAKEFPPKYIAMIGTGLRRGVRFSRLMDA